MQAPKELARLQTHAKKVIGKESMGARRYIRIDSHGIHYIHEKAFTAYKWERCKAAGESPVYVDPATLTITTPGENATPFPDIQKYLWEKWDETYAATGTGIVITDLEEFRSIHRVFHEAAKHVSKMTRGQSNPVMRFDPVAGTFELESRIIECKVPHLSQTIYKPSDIEEIEFHYIYFYPALMMQVLDFFHALKVKESIRVRFSKTNDRSPLWFDGSDETGCNAMAILSPASPGHGNPNRRQKETVRA